MYTHVLHYAVVEFLRRSSVALKKSIKLFHLKAKLLSDTHYTKAVLTKE